MQFGGKVFQTKLLSRLSHKVCRLLSSPVLLRKLTTMITRRNKKTKSAVEDTWKQKPHWNKVFPTTTITRFLVCQCNPLAINLRKSYPTQRHFCSVRFNMANDEQCGSHLMVFHETANYSLPRSRFGLVIKRSSSCVTRQNRLWGRLCQIWLLTLAVLRLDKRLGRRCVRLHHGNVLKDAIAIALLHRLVDVLNRCLSKNIFLFTIANKAD